MSATKAAFVERTIRSSKKILHLQHTQKNDEQNDIIVVNFIKRVDRSPLTMEQLTEDLFCNISAQPFLDKTLSSFTKFWPEQLNLESEWEFAISKKCYPSICQNVTEENFMFFDKIYQRTSKCYYLEPGVYTFFTNNVESKKFLNQERKNRSESCVTVKVSRRLQRVEVYLESEGSGIAFFSTYLGHFFGIIVGILFGVMLSGKRPHKPKFAYDIVRIQSLMMHTDLIEYITLGHTKTPLMGCFAFISKLKNWDNVTSGQYMKCHYKSGCCSNILFIVSRMTSFIRAVEKHFLYLLVSFELFWCLEMPQTSFCNLKVVTTWLLQHRWIFDSIQVLTTLRVNRWTCTSLWKNRNSTFA